MRNAFFGVFREGMDWLRGWTPEFVFIGEKGSHRRTKNTIFSVVRLTLFYGKPDPQDHQIKRV